MDLTLSEGQYQLVYNSFSFVIASMGAAFIFFLLVRNRVAPRHRMAVTLSTLVVAIALYHYVRIFGSWSDAFSFDGEFVQDGEPFNEGYRYVDWLLTVPLLLAELVVVLKLAKGQTRSLLVRLTVAAIAMILLGWPGELPTPIRRHAPSGESLRRSRSSTSCTCSSSSSAVPRPPEHMCEARRRTPLHHPGHVGHLPVAYMLPSVIDDAATAEVARQVGVRNRRRPCQAAVRPARTGDRSREVP